MNKHARMSTFPEVIVRSTTTASDTGLSDTGSRLNARNDLVTINCLKNFVDQTNCERNENSSLWPGRDIAASSLVKNYLINRRFDSYTAIIITETREPA